MIINSNKLLILKVASLELDVFLSSTINIGGVFADTN